MMKAAGFRPTSMAKPNPSLQFGNQTFTEDQLIQLKGQLIQELPKPLHPYRDEVSFLSEKDSRSAIRLYY